MSEFDSNNHEHLSRHHYPNKHIKSTIQHISPFDFKKIKEEPSLLVSEDQLSSIGLLGVYSQSDTEEIARFDAEDDIEKRRLWRKKRLWPSLL